MNIEQTISNLFTKRDIPFHTGLMINNVDLILDILELLEATYKIRFPQSVTNLETCMVSDLISFAQKELDIKDSNKRLDQLHKYVIVYAKINENKSTKTTEIEGPYFSNVTDTTDEANAVAAKIAEKQNNAIIKIYERNGRSDNEIMKHAKNYFDKLKCN